MQLTDCDYGNDMRNKKCVEQNVLIWVALQFIPYTVVQAWDTEAQGSCLCAVNLDTTYWPRLSTTLDDIGLKIA